VKILDPNNANTVTEY